MPSVDVRRIDGSTSTSVDLDDAVFGIEPNPAVMHQVVTAQLAAARAGTHATRTRSEVRGGGAKPWRQKGTGRSRQGSSRSPQWTGGGVAFGPRPRSYRQKTPKKMVQLALRSALSDRAAAGRVAVVEAWSFDEAKTKRAVAALSALGVDGRVVVVIDGDDDTAYRCFRNLPHVSVLPAGELNAYDVLASDWIVFTLSTLPTSTSPQQREGGEPGEVPADESSDGEAPVETSAGEGQVPEEPMSPPAPETAAEERSG